MSKASVAEAPVAETSVAEATVESMQPVDARHSPAVVSASALRRIALVGVFCGAAAFILYWLTLAPGLTWSHFGADGGELLAAAVTNGVPHPPGYPLYMLLLQGWLALTGWLLPTSDLAWRGNLLSALLAAASVGLSVPVMAHLLRLNGGSPADGEAATGEWLWLWAGIGSLAWGASQMLWSQALITEVYALHALIIVLLLWLLFGRAPSASSFSARASSIEGDVEKRQSTPSLRHLWWLALPIGLGLAHHVTIVLLLPAVTYYVYASYGWRGLRALVGAAFIAGTAAALVHLRTPLVASRWALMPSAVNWGYPDNPEGLWWLLSGSAYRSYLFDFSRAQILQQVSEWAYALTRQFSPVGLALALLGFSHLDAVSPRLRNFSLLWVLPISFYSIVYYTRDSEIYLLPVVWLLAFWMATGLAEGQRWLRRRLDSSAISPVALASVAALALAVLIGMRWSDISLRGDLEARNFVQQAAESVEPGSVLVASGDFHTFAFWYGVYGSGELLPGGTSQSAVSKADILEADVIVVNDSLYQFDWYRRLLGDMYPDVPGVGVSLSELLRAAQESTPPRPVFLSAQGISSIPNSALEQEGILWRYTP